ncbi:hypothetical protein D3C83_301830 [compost metagenome]
MSAVKVSESGMSRGGPSSASMRPPAVRTRIVILPPATLISQYGVPEESISVQRSRAVCT